MINAIKLITIAISNNKGVNQFTITNSAEITEADIIEICNVLYRNREHLSGELPVNERN